MRSETGATADRRRAERLPPGVRVIDTSDRYYAVTVGARFLAAGIPCLVRPSAKGAAVDVPADRAEGARALLPGLLNCGRERRREPERVALADPLDDPLPCKPGV